MKRFDWALENSVPISVATPASKLLLCYAVILSAAERSEESRSGLFRRQTAGREAPRLFLPFQRNSHGVF